MAMNPDPNRPQRYKVRAVNPLRWIMLRGRTLFMWSRHVFYRRFYKMDLHPSCRFSLKANLDRTNPRGVHVGKDSFIAFGAVVLAHDMSRQFHTDTFIGERCFIGAHAIVLPGVRIGDECVIGSGSVVTRDVPANSIVAGNPAKIVRSGIRTKAMGKIIPDTVAQDAALAEQAD